MDFHRARVLSLISVFLMAATVFFLVLSINQRSLVNGYEPAENISNNKSSRIKSATGLISLRSSPAVNLPLDIPEYFQKYRASCETAATKATLFYFDVSFSEDDMLEEIGWEKLPRYYDKSGNLVWGNPQKKFVGDPNPKKLYIDGYGVYNQPIYAFLANHGFGKSISKTDWNTDELLSYVGRGYPVIAWVSGDFKIKPQGVMISPDGASNPWIFAEHAVAIRGFDDSGIEIMDPAPATGYRKVTYEEFRNGFSGLNNMAIVVIPGEPIEL